MPLPPYHLGPGLAFKAIGGRHFSLISFTLSQVLVDLASNDTPATRRTSRLSTAFSVSQRPFACWKDQIKQSFRMPKNKCLTLR
jgi:hypothetical protein